MQTQQNPIRALITVRETDGELYADSRDVAGALGIEHESLLKTIDKHLATLETEFGRVRLEIGTLQTPGGPQRTRFACLTEDQAYYLATLSRNSERAKQVKAMVVKGFLEARRALQAPAPEPALTRVQLAQRWLDAEQRAEALEEDNHALEEDNHRLSLKASRLGRERAEVVEKLDEVEEKYYDALPKIRTFHAVIEQGNRTYSFADVAKMYHGDEGWEKGRNTLMANLRANKILQSTKENWNRPYQHYMQYFQVHINDFGTLVTRVRSCGLEFVGHYLPRRQREQHVLLPEPQLLLEARKKRPCLDDEELPA